MAVTATAVEQKNLLDVQNFDTKLMQLAHKRAGLPELKETQDLEVELGSIEMRLVAAKTEASDLSLALRKAENDVEQVAARAAKNNVRLEDGSVTSAKELDALQHEVVSLKARQSELEEVELEVMERLEETKSVIEVLLGEKSSTEQKLEQAVSVRDALLTEINDESADLLAQRQAISIGLPPELMALYEKVRADHGGVGAAHLHRGVCQGCHIAIDATELDRIRNLPVENVVRCEECRRILIRTAESGL